MAKDDVIELEGIVTDALPNAMAAKMFTIAGPVIVYGTVASVLYGLVYWFFTQAV